MKKTPRKKPPLTLNHETVRVLNTKYLAAIAGGTWTTEPSNASPSGCPGCVSL
jgi:hypothetical protein